MATTSFRIFQKDLWDPRVDQYFKMALKAAPHFYNVSDLLAPGGLTVRIPKVGDNFTATAVGSTTGEVSNTAVSDTATTITLNRWLASKLRITDFEMATVGRSYSLRDEYAKALGQAVAQQADKEILANITSVSRTVNDTTTALGSTDLEAALAIVESYNCPIDQLTWFFSPKAWYGEIIAVQKYYDASQFGKAITPQGVIPTLYGIPVVISNNLPAYTASSTKKINYLGTKNSIAFGFANLPGGVQGGVRLTEAYHPGGHLRTDVTCDIAFGDGIMNAYRGVKIYSTGS
jgi:hypothetical protein